MNIYGSLACGSSFCQCIVCPGVRAIHCRTPGILSIISSLIFQRNPIKHIKPMTPLHIIVLAAGNSTRLKSNLTKVMHPIAGRPMIDYVLQVARDLKPEKICMVLGMDREKIVNHLRGQRDLVFAHQKERLGTAHAVQTGLKALGNISGEVVILSGDVPRLRFKTLKDLPQVSSTAPLALLTAVLPNPQGYGRILRDSHGQIFGIVEEKNATPEERQINEVNAGVYRVEAGFLKRAIAKIKKDPIKKEFYLTELVSQAIAEKIPVLSFAVENSQEILGANTRAEMAYLNQLVNQEIVAYHLSQGVGMQDPNTIYIDAMVKLGADTFLGAGVQLLGPTIVGKGCQIEAGSILKNSKIGDEVQVKAYSYLEECVVQSKAVIGPFARLRPETVVAEEAHVGNFVELKKTRLGKGSKANHLSYLGDSIIGAKVNIGAGTITCNYDGKKKYRTTIGDGVFIGSDTQLVAPVKVGKNAYIGAGTTVTKNVPAGSLAVSRVPQKNVSRYSKNK